jgi:plastocyanin
MAEVFHGAGDECPALVIRTARGFVLPAMSLRWTIRVLGCLALLAITACAAATAQPERSLKPNELLVIEPAGQEASWTYAPAVLRIVRGATVSIVNRGREFHSVTSDDAGRPFDIGLDPNTTVTFVFGKVGRFAYHCGIHPQMKGVVEVCDGPCG